MRSAAAEQRNDLRYQLSSYLDVVTMLLAGNVGNEGALRQAAQAGDGRLFVELRQRILVAETSNRSLVSALAQLGDDLDLVELQQISASASLAASAGAPVAKSLAAKCATLRSALSAEQETDARVRTGKITVPLVGMSLLIMAAVDLSRPQLLSIRSTMNIELMLSAITHMVYGQLRRLTAKDADADRGAVSLEQVLWFVAAGVAVAVIAGILWGKIKTEAEKPIQAPSAP